MKPSRRHHSDSYGGHMFRPQNDYRHGQTASNGMLVGQYDARTIYFTYFLDCRKLKTIVLISDYSSGLSVKNQDTKLMTITL